MGDCFEVNGRLFLSKYLSDGCYLVHGEVQGQGPLSDRTFAHCWIECGDNVIDQSNGNNINISKYVYYAIGQIDKINNFYHYTIDNVLNYTLETGHWGPWELDTEY